MSAHRKHIAHVITRLLCAGSEENTITTCLGQAAQGYRVSLIHGREFDPIHYQKLAGRIDLIELPEMVHPIHPVQDRRAIRALSKLLDDLKPDLVHTHQSKAGIIGRLAAARSGVAHVVHGVHIAPFLNVGPLKRAVYVAAERYAARHTDAFICVSKGMRDASITAGIGRPEQYHVVYSGMKLDAFHDPKEPDNWRDLLGIGPSDEKPPVALMVAALEPRKRHIELVSAFRQVVEEIPDARLLFAGEGAHRPAIEDAIASAGLQDNVRLLGFHNEPARLIALSDLCLLTSMREGLPRVVVQYIACGKPALVTRVPGIEEIVTHAESGLILDENDFDGLAQSILLLFQHPARLRALQEGAKNTDVSGWREDALISGTSAVYDRLFGTEPLT